MANTQKGTQVHTLKTGSDRCEAGALHRDSRALAIAITGMRNGERDAFESSSSLLEMLRWTFAFQMAKRLTAGERTGFLRDLRRAARGVPKRLATVSASRV